MEGTEEQGAGVVNEVVFSKEGDWLYRLRKTRETDIWLLELGTESG